MRTRRGLLLGLTLAWCRPAPSAAREPFELSWSAPAECPSGAEVSAALERLAAAGSRVEAASVEIVPVAGRWQATLSTRGAQRRLEGESCAAVVQALTVVLALAAEQAELEAASAQAPNTPPQTPAPPPPAALVAPLSSASSAPGPAPAAEQPAASRPPPVGPGWGLRMGILAELGLLPGPSLGPQAALGLALGAWRVELGAALLLPRHAELAGPASPSSDIDWFSGQAALCRALGGPVGACVGAELGRLSGTGSGVDEPYTARAWWLAATVGAHVQGRLARRAALSWQLGLDFAAALARAEFGFDELGVLHRPSAVSGRIFLGLRWGR